MKDWWQLNIVIIYLGILIASISALIAGDVELSGLFWAIGFIGGIAFWGLICHLVDEFWF